MPCPKCSDTLKRCPDGITSSDCMKYVGDSNECLDFCKGQSVSEVIEQVGTEVCTIKNSTDVSNISINDLCTEVKNAYNIQGYEDKTVLNFIDFLLTYDCILQNQINNLSNQFLSFQPSVKIVWKECMGVPCSTPSTITINNAIQTLVNKVCDLQTIINNQNDKIAGLESQLININSKINQCLIVKLDQLTIATGNTDINFKDCQI